jgi:hypothetical protein
LKCYVLGILTTMRFATSALSLLVAAALVGGCDSVTAPKPDPHGDSAFVRQTKELCDKMPSLLTLDATGSLTTLVSASETNYQNVIDLQIGPKGKTGIVGLTPELSDTSPLAPTITDLAQLLGDMAFRYKSIALAAKAPDAAEPSQQIGLDQQITLAATREAEAIADLQALGIDRCLH